MQLILTGRSSRRTTGSVKGFYDMVDGLQQDVPSFKWENCAGGGRIKDYGAMKRCVTISNTDTYTPLDNRARLSTIAPSPCFPCNSKGASPIMIRQAAVSGP